MSATNLTLREAIPALSPHGDQRPIATLTSKLESLEENSTNGRCNMEKNKQT